MRGKGFYKFLLSSSFLLLLLAGCSGDEENTKNTESNAQEETTEQTTNTTDFAEAEKVVNSSCIGCHARDLTGDMGPDLTNLALTKEQIVEVLQKGRGSMPPATAKDNEELVAEYLLSLKQ